jgi:putative DNA primase/helicase
VTIDTRALARALRGEASGQNILAPGPGHSRADRSLSVKIDPAAPEGFLVHSFADDNVQDCRAQVRAAIAIRLGEGQPARARHSRKAPANERDRGQAQRSNLALKIWAEGAEPRGTVVADYLASRGLCVPDEVAGSVIRFHPALKFEGARAPAMLALFRDITTNEPCGLHRTFLDKTGRKLGRKMLGRARHAAIKLDADEHVTLGLHIGEGVESCLAAQLAGFRPVWAVGSASAISTFPVLSGIETIAILGEVDDGGVNYRAANACAKRWVDAGREALVVWPQVGGDLNEVWQEATR